MAFRIRKDNLIRLIDRREKADRERHDKAAAKFSKDQAAYVVAVREWRGKVVAALRDATKWDAEKMVEHSHYSSRSGRTTSFELEIGSVKPQAPTDPGKFNNEQYKADREFLGMVEDETVQVNSTDRLNRYIR